MASKNKLLVLGIQKTIKQRNKNTLVKLERTEIPTGEKLASNRWTVRIHAPMVSQVSTVCKKEDLQLEHTDYFHILTEEQANIFGIIILVLIHCKWFELSHCTKYWYRKKCAFLLGVWIIGVYNTNVSIPRSLLNLFACKECDYTYR